VSTLLSDIKATRQFSSRKNLRAFAAGVACSHENYDQQRWAEFGVRKGNSARHLLELLPRSGTLDLFDSWLGLPEEWDRGPNAESLPENHFACSVPTFTDTRVGVYEGWFRDTLPGYVSEMHGTLTLVHLDCDLYSSTKTVLDAIRPFIDAETVLLFDDFFGYPRYREHQWRAWEESGIEGRWLAHTPKGQALVKVVA
jgi:hypothetical protein